MIYFMQIPQKAKNIISTPLRFAKLPFFTLLKKINLISFRTIILLLLLTWFVLGPAIREADIIATILSFSLLFFIVIIFLLVLINGLLIKKKLKIDITPPNHNLKNSLHSGENSKFLIKIEPLTILPFLLLKIKISFKSSDLKCITHIIKGNSKRVRFLEEKIVFPHRGIWIIERINFSFEDCTGLFCIKWQLDEEQVNQSIKVAPPHLHETSFPIISSYQRSGSEISQTHKREGDYYDLKQYHPSDGMKKIVWNIYAKSRELVSRHPEQSMSPEGKTVIFSMPGKNEKLCALLLAYIKKISDLNLEVYSATVGSPSEIAYSHNQTKDLLIKTAWKAIDIDFNEAKNDFDTFINKFKKETKGYPNKIAIFLSSQKLNNKEDVKDAISFIENIEKLSLIPVLFIDRISGEFSNNQEQSLINKVGGKIKNLFLNLERTSQSDKSEYYNQFLTLCSNNNWQIFQN